MTTPLPQHQQNEVRARANNECQRQLDGCLHTCDLLELVYVPDDLNRMNRDTASPDNWLCTCLNCTQGTTQ